MGIFFHLCCSILQLFNRSIPHSVAICKSHISREISNILDMDSTKQLRVVSNLKHLAVLQALIQYS